MPKLFDAALRQILPNVEKYESVPAEVNDGAENHVAVLPLPLTSFHVVPDPEYDLGLPASKHSAKPLVTIEELYEILICHTFL
jgi:hypothetical protein